MGNTGPIHRPPQSTQLSLKSRKRKRSCNTKPSPALPETGMEQSSSHILRSFTSCFYGVQVCHLVDNGQNIVKIGGGALCKDSGVVISYFTEAPELPADLNGGKGKALCLRFLLLLKDVTLATLVKETFK